MGPDSAPTARMTKRPSCSGGTGRLQVILAGSRLRDREHISELWHGSLRAGPCHRRELALFEPRRLLNCEENVAWPGLFLSSFGKYLVVGKGGISASEPSGFGADIGNLVAPFRA